MANSGFLFNIQKFCLHDGPGIRTTVFFKGCPLSCRWCSNPESQRAEPCLLWDGDKSAPDSREYSLEETLEICLQDRPFYEESGGGVTLSGGEVFVQHDFAAALLGALKNEHIHTALETSAYTPPDVFRKIVADGGTSPDLLLFDIKHYDDERHVEGTGVHNGIILENLKTALSLKKELLPRIPLIPGYNDAAEDGRGFARLLVPLGITRVQLLPFHQFGEKKYAMLKLPYAMQGIPQLHREDMEAFRRVMSEHGIDCFF